MRAAARFAGRPAAAGPGPDLQDMGREAYQTPTAPDRRIRPPPNASIKGRTAAEADRGKMGAPDRRRQSSLGGRAIAAFDFDGTLTSRDSYTAFLRWRAGDAAYAEGLVALAPALLRWLGDRDRGALKAAASRRFLSGAPRDRLEREADAFAHARFDSLLRPDALDAWRAHGEAGDLRAIVTASPETVVAPFAARLGADRLIGTRLAFDGDGRATGGFDGANCRGAEKVARLRATFGDDVRLAAAYGDTSGDREMLALAKRPHMRVFKGRP